MPSFVELCAGAGGMSLGFISAGYTPLLLVDNDKTCVATLKKNHPDVNVICADISELSFRKTFLKEHSGNVDVLIAGIPCQSMSVAGERKGLDDPRGELIYSFTKALKRLKPKIFVIENVKGMLSHNEGKTFETILEVLKSVGEYNIVWKVLNANDYGVAQKRERLFIVGRIGDAYSFPLPNPNRLVLRDVIYDIKDEKNEGYEYSEKKRNVMMKIPEGGCWINLTVEEQKEYLGKSFNSGGGKRGIAKRLAWDVPCLTLTCSPNQKQTERCHPEHTRPLNVKEYTRIQSFPDDYVFTGSIASKYKQIGNAVPVLLAKAVAKSLLQYLLE